MNIETLRIKRFPKKIFKQIEKYNRLVPIDKIPTPDKVFRSKKAQNFLWELYKISEENNGDVKITNEKLSVLFNVCVKTISRWLKRAEDSGAISMIHVRVKNSKGWATIRHIRCYAVLAWKKYEIIPDLGWKSDFRKVKSDDIVEAKRDIPLDEIIKKPIVTYADGKKRVHVPRFPDGVYSYVSMGYIPQHWYESLQKEKAMRNTGVKDHPEVSKMLYKYGYCLEQRLYRSKKQNYKQQ